jgi:hypothetical protein
MARKFGIAVIVVAILFVALAWMNPLRRPEPLVRNWLENTTPLGSGYLEVLDIASQEGWYDDNSQGSDGHTTGKYIRGELGEYQGIPFETSVTVFWEFDDKGILENIRIWKTRDAP